MANLTGLSAGDPLPGNYLEILFAQGATSGFAGTRPILLIGNKTSAGNGTVDAVVYGPDTVTPALTENDVINLTGTGSEIHRMWRRAQRIAKTSVGIYFIIVTESAGTAASKQNTLANVPTGGGTVTQYVGDEFVEYSFLANDTLASITAGIVAAINGKTHWPVTAAQSTSVGANDSWTMTARQKGPRGNWIRQQTRITFGNGGTPNTTLTGGTDAFLTSGATADSNTTALGTIASARYYYIASAAEDATQFGAVVTQVNNMALPVVGIRQRAFAGSVDTQSNVDTIAAGLNAARAEIVWQKAGLWTPSELAAHFAALYAVEELPEKPKCNFSGYPRNDSESANWGPPAPRDQTAWPTTSVQRIALNNGVTPIAVTSRGGTYLVKRITTRSLNGSNADYRIRDAHKVTICDFFGDELIQKERDQLGGKNLADDPAPGSPNQPDKETATPNRYRDLINGLVNRYGNALSLLQQIDITKAEMIVQRNAVNRSRMDSSIPLYPCDILDSTASLILQVG
jgi:phage tail sheath gpL-like